jgi:hypothetical protein
MINLVMQSINVRCCDAFAQPENASRVAPLLTTGFAKCRNALVQMALNGIRQACMVFVAFARLSHADSSSGLPAEPSAPTTLDRALQRLREEVFGKPSLQLQGTSSISLSRHSLVKKGSSGL